MLFQLHLIFLFQGLQSIKGQATTIMNTQYQLKKMLFNSTTIPNNAICFQYGIFSQYTPLSNITQFGEIGILDSNCYHIHSAIGQYTNKINFILYDCIDQKEQTIEKSVAFIGSDGTIYKQSYQLNLEKYENFWYFFGLVFNLKDNSITLYIQQKEVVLYTQDFNVQYPYQDTDLELTFGGDLFIKNNQMLYTELLSKLSYFPGRMIYLSPVSFDISYKCQSSFLQPLIISNQKLCKCFSSTIKTIPDTIIQKLDHSQFISETINCDSYYFQSWIRIKERKVFIEDIYYQLIKISSNIQNPKLVDENLSTFQLFYKLKGKNNQIIITTYSYTLPTVNVNFVDTPYLITKIFDLDVNIQLWHFVRVIKSQKSIQIKIHFYNVYEIHQYDFESIVNQFSQVQFKLQYGNLRQTLNYLTFELISMMFFNCETNQDSLNSCHYSCKDCDGPTKYDCLSCDETQTRIYLEEYKACICAYGTIDSDQQCINYQTYGVNIVKGFQEMFYCSYGYFEFEGNCWQCPSTIRNNLITCIDCVMNPKTWIKNPYCSFDFVTDNTQSPYQKLDYNRIYYTFDGSHLKVCELCDNIPDIYEDYQKTQNPIYNFNQNRAYGQTEYQNSQDRLSCFFFKDCMFCQIDIFKPQCLECRMNYAKKNDFCQLQTIQSTIYQICDAPNYINFNNICIKCPIENCHYCFEYFRSDYYQNTLFSQQQFSTIDEEIVVGCAECKQGFIYDFTIQKCIYQEPKLINCLRSYINQQGEELCTLSSINDFTVAPEITNCQNTIYQCRQCVQTPQFIVKCIICEEGYGSALNTGICYVNEKLVNTRYSVQWYDYTIWKMIVQSFSIVFMKGNPGLYTWQNRLNYYSVECLPGYEIIAQKCVKYCDENCQQCLKQESLQQFTCTLCSLNYYQQHYRVQKNGKCLVCPPLCLVCQERSNDDILSVNPQFKIKEANIQFSTYCVKSIPNSNVFINPYLKIASYNYGDPSKSAIQYSSLWFCDNFFGSEYSDFENYFDFSYLNEIGLQQFILTIQIQISCQDKVIMNSFKSKIFSLQSFKLELTGIPHPLALSKTFYYSNFDQVEIRNLLIQMNEILIFQFSNRADPIDFQIFNVSFSSNKQRSSEFRIQFDVYRVFHLYNVSIIDVSFDNIVIFDINSISKDGNFLIDLFVLENCQFNQTTLFAFKTIQKKIVIQNLFINQCEFNRSILLSFNQEDDDQSTIVIRSITIKNSLFFNTSIIQSLEKNKFSIDQFQMIENQIENSSLIRVSNDLLSSNVVLQKNYFIKSILFEKLFSISYENQLIFNEINVTSNRLHNFKVLTFDQIRIPYLIQLKNLDFIENINPQLDIQDYLFQLSSSNLLIQNVLILNTQNLRYFYFFNISTIKFENVTVWNQIQVHKIPLQQDCLINQYQHSKLLFVQGFQELTLNLLTLQNQITIDQPLIEILSNVAIIQEKTEKVLISNFNATGNILLKINQGKVFSIISIFSEKVQEVFLKDILYLHNCYHQYITDPTFNSASLLFINSLHSAVLIEDIQCIENSLTNSSNTFIAISSKELTIFSITASHHNYVGKEFWNQYYEIQLQNNHDDMEINYLIEQALSFQNIGGVMSLLVDTLTLKKAIFSYIIAESSSVLSIFTKGNGMLVLSDFNISYCLSNLLSKSEKEGSISINSKDSYLTLRLQNFTLKNIYNKLAPAILSIQSSGVENDIIIQNGEVWNCFSLINSFSAILFNSETADQHQVKIENILIHQSEQGLLQFDSQLGLLDTVMLSQIVQDNAIFHIQGCKLKINKFVFEGVAQSSILKLINCKTLQLMDIFLDKVTTFYNLQLINIEIASQFQSIIQIQNLNIHNISFLQIQNQQFYLNPKFLVKYSKCKTYQLISQSTNNKQLETQPNNFQQISSYQTNKGSILLIICSNNQTKINLKQISLINNDCKFCLNGLMFIQLIDFTLIKIDEFYCIGNKIKQFGCISALSDKQMEGKLFIVNSLFLNNQGIQGTALSSINVKTFLFNTRILNNIANLLGGGLYLDLTSNEFQIKLTIIQNNEAREGGGIYLNGDGILSQSNFVKSLLVLNNAQLETKNLQELPSHLDISINFKTLFSNKQIINSKQISSLQLNPYKIIQQGKLFIASSLMIPSNQGITKYQIYNPKYQKFVSYLFEFSIQFKNSFNELLLNYSNSICRIVQSTFDIKTLKKLESTNITQIYYDQKTNNFNLGELTFSLDPYNQSDKVFEISAFCKAKNYTDELQYNIRVKTLVCQLGEFYIVDGCSTCQYQQGFYSVTYNATKCSIFDKTKFDAITANNIQLKPGFWRPHYQSDIVVECFKNLNSCKGGWNVGDEICKIGYIGGLCEECDKFNLRGAGYYFKNDQNLSCLNCSDFSVNFVSLILIGLWAIISTLITLRSVEKTNYLFMSFKINQKFSNILFKLNLDQESILLKMYLNYMWIFSLIFTFNIQFSFQFIFVNKMNDTSYFMSRNLDCKLVQWFGIQLLYSRIIVMLILVFILILVTSSGIHIFFIINKIKFRNNIISITLLYLYIQNYAAFINQLLSILAKRQISNIDYVQGDVSLLFDSQNHYFWMITFAMPVSLFIGLILPISLLYVLYINKKQLNEIKFRRHFGYLVNEYKVHSIFWEWIKLWKKTIIIFILIYFETNTFLKGFLIVMCLIIYQVFTQKYSPYIYEKLNNLDLQTGQLCSIAIILASVEYISEQQADFLKAEIFQILIILLCIALSYPFIFQILFIYYNKYKLQVLMLLIMILRKLSLKSQLIFRLIDKLNQWKQRQDRIYKNFQKMRSHTILKQRLDKEKKRKICIGVQNLQQTKPISENFKLFIQ
ncbi:unnamed protein product [Paramecium octaurelia]|uniref:Transmembrane protein n=1 Tax=Paramecium octaurelia TaxID=43137 RepID=A0A8S1YCP8_PAROT|nr:unnamed protein product [Paramecium octaurelia]